MSSVRPEEPVTVLGRQARALTEVGKEVSEGLAAAAGWHRWLYDGSRQGKHRPAWDDFADTLRLLASAHATLEELIVNELQLAQRFTSWAEVGEHLQMTRQGAQQLARPGRTTNNLTRLQNMRSNIIEAAAHITRRKIDTMIRRRPRGPVEVGGWARDHPATAAAVVNIGKQRAVDDTIRLARLDARRFEELQHLDEKFIRTTRAFRAQQRRAKERQERAEKLRRAGLPKPIVAPPLSAERRRPIVDEENAKLKREWQAHAELHTDDEAERVSEARPIPGPDQAVLPYDPTPEAL